MTNRQPAATQTATAPAARESQVMAYAAARDIPAVLAGVTIAARPTTPRKPRAAATGTTRTRKVAELHRCRCSQLVMESGEWTGCEAMVRGIFAPGHDAKAASMLVRAAKENSGDPEVGGLVFDEAASVWRNPTEIFAGTKLGQKIAAKLGQEEAVAKQAAETFAQATGASEAAPTESTDAELAKKPAKTAKVVQHRRQGAYAGETTETSEIADLAWEDVVHPADRGWDVAAQEQLAGA